MSLRDKKKIAVIISNASSEYQKNLIDAISKRATADGYYTVVFNFMSTFGWNPLFAHGERYLAQLPNFSDYDGVFLCLDTFADNALCDSIFNAVSSEAKCPVVSVRREAGKYNVVLIRDDDSMRDVTQHLIDAHGCRDFFYVSGPKDHPDAIKRLKCFRKVLADNGISFDENKLLYGNFWRDQGENIVEKLLDICKDKLPDVIVCANDYTAIAVCNSLTDRGYKIPEDVRVTGFDDIEEAAWAVPSLTSVRLDVTEMADRAYDMFIGMVNGVPVRHREYVSTTVIPRESCGCGDEYRRIVPAAGRKYYEDNLRLGTENQQSILMSVECQACENIERLNEVIMGYIFHNRLYKDFFMFLNDYSWANIDAGEMNGLTDEVRLRTVVVDGDLKKNVNIKLDIHDLLPEEYVSAEPCTYYVMPLHYLEKGLGYCMINFRKGGLLEDFFQYFGTIICNSIENIRVGMHMNTLIDRLSNMYISDATTGLMNRHGFNQESVRMYRLMKEERRTMSIIAIDMDGLKTINDTFGHAEGDEALLVISKAMRWACFSDELCFRVGGDEFQVLAMDYSENSIYKFRKRFFDFLQNYNETSDKKYSVLASFGYALCYPEANKTLNEWLTLSDDMMYEMKEINRPVRVIIKEA